jgi:hypothetical protein
MSTLHSGFTLSATARGFIAVVFTCAAFFAVSLVESPAAPNLSQQQPINAQTPTSAPALLQLIATYPVQKWTVLCAGKEIPVTITDAQRCQVTLPDARAACFIHAEAVDALATGPVALRWQQGKNSGILWGEGAIAAPLPERAAQ